MTRAAVVANPAKLDDLDAARRTLEEVCARHGADAPIWLETTEEDPGGGQTRDALAQGADLVCALGGDGTVRAVAEVLAGGDVPLGLLPGGTGNLLARALGLRLDSIEHAMQLALTGRTDRVDVGALRLDDDAEEHVFLVMAGVGLDAETMDRTDERLKGLVGWPAYVVGALRAAVGGGFGTHVRLDDGATIRRAARAVIVGNSGRLTGGLELMPDARLDDGLLDVAVVAPSGVLGWARTLWTVTTAGKGHRHLDRRQAAEVRVAVDVATTTQLDGDPVGEHRRLVCRVRPGALLVRVAAD